MPSMRQLFDLGFLPEEEGRKPPLYLGRANRLSSAQVAWDVLAWVVLALGIFLRQGLVFAPLGWTVDRLSAGAFLASVAIALAVFPFFMRWFNRRRRQPGLLHIALPFAFGFFLDLAKISVLQLPNVLLG